MDIFSDSFKVTLVDTLHATIRETGKPVSAQALSKKLGLGGSAEDATVIRVAVRKLVPNVSARLGRTGGYWVEGLVNEGVEAADSSSEDGLDIDVLSQVDEEPIAAE